MNDLPPATLSLWRSQQHRGAANTEDSGLVDIPMVSLASKLDRALPVKLHLPNGMR